MATNSETLELIARLRFESDAGLRNFGREIEGMEQAFGISRKKGAKATASKHLSARIVKGVIFGSVRGHHWRSRDFVFFQECAALCFTSTRPAATPGRSAH
jgi:hypothetical protein